MLPRLCLLTALSCLAAPLLRAEEPAWMGTLERISTGVVSIRVDSTRSFDTEWNASSQATGFVVDAKRGLILTNRHVVTPGPVVAEAIFLNNEEVELTPVYRDPVHDFGFFRYNPDDLHFIEPAELPLAPGAAVVGREIRVVGNDAGEKLSILAGTLARLDREAPDYGLGNYNDFNTFYLQAASSTSGGSSGSPVVDIAGNVVALNAGANGGAASSFFLPLDRVERALRLIQAGKPVPRGTLQAVFVHKPYDELRRLGLDPESEVMVRTALPAETGMLVVDEVVPRSPADGRLEPGDILLRVNGELVTGFVPLAEILDNAVGRTVKLELERGGKRVTERVPVTDLHAITPDAYLEFGGAVVNDLSYQQSRHYNRPISGVYVADPGYILSRAGIPRDALITEVDGTPIANLGDLMKVLSGLADGDRATFRYTVMRDPRNTMVRSVQMDRTWFPTRHCVRDDDTGVWPCRELEASGSKAKARQASTVFPSYSDPRVDAIVPSLVMVNFDLPYPVSGVADRHYYGTGLIVDRERGYVLVDRNTVPVAMGDVRITFAGSLEVPGRVAYIHPLHNLAIVAYDPASIGDTPVKAAELTVRQPIPGDRVWVVGLKADHQVAHQASVVASVDPLNLPLSRTLRFRDTNIEVISLVNAPINPDGVLLDEHGRVAGSWSSFGYQADNESGQVSFGIGSELIRELVEAARSGEPIYSLEAEVAYTPLFEARKFGVSDEWLKVLEDHNPRARRALRVTRTVAASPAARLLRSGDILLAIDGRPVSSFRELERAVQKPEVEATVWRNGKALTLAVQTAVLDGTGIERAVSWAGALLHDPHRAMAAQRNIDPSGVYVAYFSYGSPATRYGLYAGRRIVSVDGRPTNDLQAFIDAVSGRQNRESVRLKTITWNGAVEVITLKLDNHYWPAYEIRRTEDGWTRIDIG
ncbi:MAG TPA: trypsin-like peptidase domain-containing protein [Woeseiaceae bacterium]|nr:trypsin-like peptidase domain-containing protein [Woeseiaceae bacterium]